MYRYYYHTPLYPYYHTLPQGKLLYLFYPNLLCSYYHTRLYPYYHTPMYQTILYPYYCILTTTPYCILPTTPYSTLTTTPYYTLTTKPYCILLHHHTVPLNPPLLCPSITTYCTLTTPPYCILKATPTLPLLPHPTVPFLPHQTVSLSYTQNERVALLLDRNGLLHFLQIESSFNVHSLSQPVTGEQLGLGSGTLEARTNIMALTTCNVQPRWLCHSCREALTRCVRYGRSLVPSLREGDRRVCRPICAGVAGLLTCSLGSGSFVVS